MQQVGGQPKPPVITGGNNMRNLISNMFYDSEITTKEQAYKLALNHGYTKEQFEQGLKKHLPKLVSSSNRTWLF